LIPFLEADENVERFPTLDPSFIEGAGLEQGISGENRVGPVRK
jgi:hypothetical protein